MALSNLERVGKAVSSAVGCGQFEIGSFCSNAKLTHLSVEYNSATLRIRRKHTHGED